MEFRTISDGGREGGLEKFGRPKIRPENIKSHLICSLVVIVQYTQSEILADVLSRWPQRQWSRLEKELDVSPFYLHVGCNVHFLPAVLLHLAVGPKERNGHVFSIYLPQIEVVTAEIRFVETT